MKSLVRISNYRVNRPVQKRAASHCLIAFLFIILDFNCTLHCYSVVSITYVPRLQKHFLQLYGQSNTNSGEATIEFSHQCYFTYTHDEPFFYRNGFYFNELSRQGKLICNQVSMFAG